MKKIDYAVDNLPICWDDFGRKDILEHLCPSDFELENIEECYYSEVHLEPCEKCWNEDIRGDK